MPLADDVAHVARLLDAYATRAWKMHIASDNPQDAGVLPSMRVGEVNDDGWVEWKLLPSTLTEADVQILERDFSIEFPPLFRAYLLARFHLFDQAKSRRYDQQILLPPVPSHRPLTPIRDMLAAWRRLIDAGYVPFAQWGDGWGPMCFDSDSRHPNGDCPIVWIDHEQAIPLGQKAAGQRPSVQPLAQPLYSSYREFLSDVFGEPPA